MGNFKAVLTGDVVGSSKLTTEELESLKTCLQESRKEFDKYYRNVFQGKIDFFRSDAWQALLQEPNLSLRAALYLRASVLKHGKKDTRIAIGVGSIDEASGKRISLLRGQAFTLSGNALDKMNENQKMTISMPEDKIAWAKIASLTLEVCDTIISALTVKQVEKVQYALLGITQEEIAERIREPITQQAVSIALGRADWQLIRNTLDVFENHILWCEQ